MRIVAILSIIIIALNSCNRQKNQEESDVKEDASNCYQYVNDKDTVLLKIFSTGDSITGTLIYNFYEKDKNVGTIRGQRKGALIIADYSFSSEGVNSVRQVVFKKEDDAFIEGNGSIIDRQGRTVFKNIDSLDFSGSILLMAVDCK